MPEPYYDFTRFGSNQCDDFTPLQHVGINLVFELRTPRSQFYRDYPLYERRLQDDKAIMRMLLAAGADIDREVPRYDRNGVGRSLFEIARGLRERPELSALIRAHLARMIRATARGSQVWAPHVAQFLI